MDCPLLCRSSTHHHLIVRDKRRPNVSRLPRDTSRVGNSPFSCNPRRRKHLAREASIQKTNVANRSDVVFALSLALACIFFHRLQTLSIFSTGSYQLKSRVE